MITAVNFHKTVFFCRLVLDLLMFFSAVVVSIIIYLDVNVIDHTTPLAFSSVFWIFHFEKTYGDAQNL